MNYRIVVDTNVIVSAVLNPKSKPAVIIDAVINGDLFLISSDAIFEEVRRVFSYGKIKRLLRENEITQTEINTFIETLSDLSFLVPGKLRLYIVKSDPADNKFLSCAAEGKADFIVSGNHNLTELETYQNIQILSPTDFLSHLPIVRK